MQLLETILGLLFAATILSLLARRIGVPYPAFLALAGTVLAFLPGAPQVDLPPELILALFVAPILLDAAYDTSLRDLRTHWLPISSLVLIAVGLTTGAVALVARWYFPDMPWAAAIALGALLAPPDAVSALAVLREVNPPSRIRTILEGESLLNDASALLVYKFAVGAVTAGSFSLTGVLPTFALVLIGSAGLGFVLAWPIGLLVRSINDAPSSVILQFVLTFGMWLLAEAIGLSAVIAAVVFGLTSARQSLVAFAARTGVASFAIWETATFVLNVLAFMLLGLQLRPILDSLDEGQFWTYVAGTSLILGCVIAIRLAWVLVYAGFSPRGATDVDAPHTPRAKTALMIGWSGMRGIVTLAAALALPVAFPYREFLQSAAFGVVLGTLLLQGLTLKPLVTMLKLPKDGILESEVSTGRAAALQAAVDHLDGDHSAAAERLRSQFGSALVRAEGGNDPHAAPDYALRVRIVPAARKALTDLRNKGHIGDQAFQVVEEELDWLELSSQARISEQ